MRRLVVAVLLGTALLLGPPASGQEPAEPTLTTDRPAYDRGQTIRVEGEGWPARTLLTVELCGNEAANGSVDCDGRNATTAATTADGSLLVDLLASAPPSPCPCVVHVFSPSGTSDLGVRVRIVGMPVAEVTSAATPSRQLEVTALDLDVSNRVATWFGAAPTGTLRATVANTGEVPVRDAALRVRWGRSPGGTRMIDADDLGTVAPGETVEVEIPVRMDPLPFGRYVVSADVAGFAASADTTALSRYPTGLILVLALLGAGLVARRVWRRRTDDVDAPTSEAPVPVAPPAPVAAPVHAAAGDAEVDVDDADEADLERERRVPVPVRAGLGLALVLAVLVTGVVRGCGDGGDRPRLDDDALCAELREIDPGRSFGGDSAVRLAAAAVVVHDLDGRAPRAVAGAIGAIVAAIDEDDSVLDLPRLDQGDRAYNEAYQAAYALRFDSEVIVAAALLEQYAVDECGLPPSGAFDIDSVRASDIDAADAPVLTQDEIEALRVEFTPADLDGFQLEPFQIPEVEFEEDLEQFQLDVPEIPQPTFGP